MLARSFAAIVELHGEGSVHPKQCVGPGHDNLPFSGYIGVGRTRRPGPEQASVHRATTGAYPGGRTPRGLGLVGSDRDCGDDPRDLIGWTKAEPGRLVRMDVREPCRV